MLNARWFTRIALLFDFGLAQVLKAGRCNNHLDVSKMIKALPDIKIPAVDESIHGVFQRMAENLKKEGQFPPPSRKGPKPA